MDIEVLRRVGLAEGMIRHLASDGLDRPFSYLCHIFCFFVTRRHPSEVYIFEHARLRFSRPLSHGSYIYL